LEFVSLSESLLSHAYTSCHVQIPLDVERDSTKTLARHNMKETPKCCSLSDAVANNVNN
jgi:hypothetical protein